MSRRRARAEASTDGAKSTSGNSAKQAQKAVKRSQAATDDTLAAAIVYIERGFAPVPVEFGSKKPTLEEWPKLRLTGKDLPEHFNGAPMNIGILLGEASGWLVDVDLDCREACIAAEFFFPATGMKHGRKSSPGSHRWYVCRDAETLQFKDINDDSPDADKGREHRTLLLEIRVRGQTVVPPSVHTCGESIVWEANEKPAEINVKSLERAAALTACAALLARHWPASGARHNFALALAGFLLRRGIPIEECELLLEAGAVAAHDEEAKDRRAAVRSTAEQLEKEGATTGLPTLAEILGEKKAAGIAGRINAWLDLQKPCPARASSTAVSTSEGTPWPDPLCQEAFYGLPGDIVRAIEPHTEADPAGLLIQIYVAFGNAIGRSAHYLVEGAEHFMNIFAVLVGVSSKARKGTSSAHILRPFLLVDESWARDRVAPGGLSSGEGLIWQVRDPIFVREKISAKGQPPEFDDVEKDPGVSDKRLLVVEAEYANTLKVMTREGNTLSGMIRNAWDRGDLRTLTKNTPAKATGAHISIVGHITVGELRRYLNLTEAGSGFANRFLWVCVKRARILPDGGALDTVDFSELVNRLRCAVEFARGVRQIRRDDLARDLWHTIYEEASEGRPGMLGAVTSRAEAQVLRLSTVAALMDMSDTVRIEHLMAALSIWDYCSESARWIFGDAVGDPLADEILQALRKSPDGLTRTQIRDLCGRNQNAGAIGRALGTLLQHGLAKLERREAGENGGRPPEIWTATGSGGPAS